MNASLLFLILKVFAVAQSSTDEDPVHRGPAMLPKDFFRVTLPPPEFVDPVAGLDPRAPEVMHRIASELQRVADGTRQVVSTALWAETDIAKSQFARFFYMGQQALLDPRLIENRVFVPQWAEWWGESHRAVPYDTRLDADRFVAYLVERAHGRILTTADITNFENKLDEQYQKVIPMLLLLYSTRSLHHQSNVTIATSEESPTNVLHIELE